MIKPKGGGGGGGIPAFIDGNGGGAIICPLLWEFRSGGGGGGGTIGADGPRKSEIGGGGGGGRGVGKIAIDSTKGECISLQDKSLELKISSDFDSITMVNSSLVKTQPVQLNSKLSWLGISIIFSYSR